MANPVVIFLIPDQYERAHMALMSHISEQAMEREKIEPGSIEFIGYVSPNPIYGASVLSFLRDSGINPQAVLALVLFGQTGDDFNFNSMYADTYVLGSVVIPESSASIPTICLPSIATGWLQDVDKREIITKGYGRLLKNGRQELSSGMPTRFITLNNSNWN